MGIFRIGNTVGCPAGVGDAAMAVNGRGFQQRLQNFYLTWSAQPREMTIRPVIRISRMLRPAAAATIPHID